MPSAWLQPATLDEALRLRRRARRRGAGAGRRHLRRHPALDRASCRRRPRSSPCATCPTCDGVRVDDGDLVLGAMATHRAVETDPRVLEGWPALAACLRLVANERVRNQATIGGVLADADYASDPPALLSALAAEAVLAGPARPARPCPCATSSSTTTRPSSSPTSCWWRCACRRSRPSPPTASSAPATPRTGRAWASRSPPGGTAAGGCAACGWWWAPSPAGRRSCPRPARCRGRGRRRRARRRDRPPLRRGARPDRRRARLVRLPPAHRRGRGAPGAGRGRGVNERVDRRPSATRSTSSGRGCCTPGWCARRSRPRASWRVDASGVPGRRRRACCPRTFATSPATAASSATRTCCRRASVRHVGEPVAAVAAATERAARAAAELSRWSTTSCPASTSRRTRSPRARRWCTTLGGLEHAERPAPRPGQQRLPPLPPAARPRRGRPRGRRRRGRGRVDAAPARSTPRWSRTPAPRSGRTGG